MANFDEQIKRMRALMNSGSLNENNSSNHNIEYCVEGADGNIYGIIRENTKYYIKTTEKGNETIAESYNYIGGFCNKKDYEYNSYSNALKQLEMKLMSLNEAYDKHSKTELLDPFKKEDLVIEGTEKMRDEIARQRQIMANVNSIINEGDISPKNIGVPEAPKTLSFNPKVGEPFSNKANATLDKDLKAIASNPDGQGDPFSDKKDVNDKDMQSDKNPKCDKKCDCKDAEYVPDNSVANQKPKGAKAVKMNENCDDWGSCGLPSQPGVGEDIPDVMGENSDDIVGQDNSSMDSSDNILTDNDDSSLDDSTYTDEPIDDSMSDDAYENDSMDDDVMSDEEFDDLLNNALGDNNSYDDENNGFDEVDDHTFESVKKKYVDSIVESISKKIIKEAKRNTGVGILPEKWFTTNKSYNKVLKLYNKLANSLREIKWTNDANEVDTIVDESENIYLKLKEIFKTLLNGKELKMRDAEIYYSEYNSGTPEDAKTLLKSIDDIWGQITNVWDSKYAKEADKEFNDKNKEWNAHKVKDLNYNVPNDPNDIDALEQKDSAYANENKQPRKTVKEEATVLHDFGKHPGYRKKPMTLPSNNDSEKDGYKDWNDDSVKKDEPFGQKIGSSSPFDEKVKIITDAVMAQIKEMYKKKS